MEDMGRFRTRVLDLQRHFGQANADIDKIITSEEKITSRGRKIENLDFAEATPTEIAKQNGSTRSPEPAQAPTATPGQRPREGARIIRQPDLLAGE
jgi:DNA recombination protein RmuC